MKQDLTEIVVILDRSGSMSSIKDDVIGGFNSFIEEQRKVEGFANVSLYMFDDQYESVYEGTELYLVPKLTNETFVPRGTTALLDSIGKTINSVGARLANTPESERPSKVMVVIITDGHENSSKEFTAAQIKEMTEHQTNVYGWQFLYIGANQDSFSVAQSYGIGHAFNFSADSKGTSDMYGMLRNVTACYRSTGVMDLGKIEE